MARWLLVALRSPPGAYSQPVDCNELRLCAGYLPALRADDENCGLTLASVRQKRLLAPEADDLCGASRRTTREACAVEHSVQQAAGVRGVAGRRLGGDEMLHGVDENPRWPAGFRGERLHGRVARGAAHARRLERAQPAAWHHLLPRPLTARCAASRRLQGNVKPYCSHAAPRTRSSHAFPLCDRPPRTILPAPRLPRGHEEMSCPR